MHLIPLNLYMYIDKYICNHKKYTYRIKLNVILMRMVIKTIICSKALLEILTEIHRKSLSLTEYLTDPPPSSKSKCLQKLKCNHSRGHFGSKTLSSCLRRRFVKPENEKIRVKLHMQLPDNKTGLFTGVCL